jgi:putative transposase
MTTGGINMPGNLRCTQIHLPKHWAGHVKSSVLQVISLAHYAIAYARGWAANSINARVRLASEVSRLKEQVALLNEELRIKDARMGQIDSHRRPFYPPQERLAILELKAARGWSRSQTAKRFLVTPETISSWMKRIDEQGPDALVQLREPVNKFPDFVQYIVQRLKIFCPTLGKKKIAETLARAGLHLAATTVGRMLQEPPRPKPTYESKPNAGSPRVVTSKYPNHLWNVDLTVVPTLSGFWTAWIPFSLPQCWPFCFWVAVIEDHFSRRIMGITSFTKQPNSVDVQSFLGRTIHKTGSRPRHIVTDKGPQFYCDGFKDWCRRNKIKPRFGAIGRHGNIAVVERLILSIKCLLGCLLLVPFRREQFQQELSLIAQWYNQYRPHTALGGKTPNEVYDGRFPANRKPRFEPRAAWPRASPCAAPRTIVKGKPGVRIELQVTFHKGRKHLPVVTLHRAA